jgi:hypothetical protein
MKERFCDDKLEDCITEIFESFIGLGVADMCFIEYTPMDTGEDIESSISRENLERRKE